MSIVTRYFSTSSAGAGDGTTWADRAALFSSGTWSVVITGFDFTSDSMEARIGPGTYACSQSLVSGVFANPPSATALLSLVACDSSGSLLPHPNPGWVSAQPVWDTSGMPLIETASNIIIVSGAYMVAILLRFASSASASGVISCNAYHCVTTNTLTSISARGISANGALMGCVAVVTGSSYQGAISGHASNCRMECNASAGAGERIGHHTPSGDGNTVIGAAQGSVSAGGTGSTISNYIVIGGTNSIAHAGSSASMRVISSVLVGSSGYAIGGTLGGGFLVGCRARDNTSGVSQAANNHVIDCITSAGSDADEFVDAASGDYRIKYGSILWGKGIGAGDGPATITG